jgi:heme exporter protein B
MAKIWWIVHKDLLMECRARRAWPVMLLIGIITALVLGIQLDLPPEPKSRLAGGLLWLATVFAGMPILDRALAAEREDGCWEALFLYPTTPTTIFFAKLAVNVVAIGALQCVLIPLFVLLCDVPLLARPGAMLLVAALGNLGIASAGTLVGGATAGMERGSNWAALLVLPLVVPVVLAAAEATRLATQDQIGPDWWRWTQLLAAFAVVFVVAGATLIDFVVEE